MWHEPFSLDETDSIFSAARPQCQFTKPDDVISRDHLRGDGSLQTTPFPFTKIHAPFPSAALEELKKSQRPTIAASPSDHPVPLPLPAAEADSPPITHHPVPHPTLRSLCGTSINLQQDIFAIDLGDPIKSCAVHSSMNLKQDIPEIDLGDPTQPFIVQPVKTESYVLIDVSHLEEPSQPQLFETECCCSVFSFIKRLFTL
ncbi:uncharacterized protein [Haliotis asinina]|uniref:uncharacterized protein n=1 Tax=Haliotis asinina TaxID=109174 RepID=UPI0035322A4D